MNFTGEITLGNILTIVAFIAAVIGSYYGLKGQMEVFKTLMEASNKRFEQTENRHEQRLTKLEDNHRTITGIVDRIVGQNEERIRWDGNERRSPTEPRRR